jgi:hypothetical protein
LHFARFPVKDLIPLRYLNMHGRFFTFSVHPVLALIIFVTGPSSRGLAAETNPIAVERTDGNSTPGSGIPNRTPLSPSAFIKLPIGAIRPQGWLRSQLELEAKGMTGHLPELSHWCRFDSNAWSSATGEGHSGWEELPYWLKGYGDLGYVLRDERIIKESRKWIDAVLASQEPDGWFGPRALKTGLKGKPDLWPHMVMCNVLQSFYEFSNDDRVLPFLTKYFQWLNQQPSETFGEGYWPKVRFGDNLETVYWLYNRTGEPWLLNLGKKIHEHMFNWTDGVHDWHNVNVAQGFREPTVYSQQVQEPRFIYGAENNYRIVMALYGQFPGGGFAGDENCRPGYTDPRQGFETCGMVEFMHSFEMLTKITGASVWADRCEEIAFNSLPAALTPDLKGLHYLTCANQVQLDGANKAPAIQNTGDMFSYTPGELFRCCQHNVSHGWPYFAEEIWLATPDHGLCASLYSASDVDGKVGGGVAVHISESTDYPFDDTLNFKIKLGAPSEFPLYLRIPKWCESPSLKINGQKAQASVFGDRYAVIKRVWKDGDRILMKLPMKVQVKKWENNKNAVSIDYGPLTFSLKIAERWARNKGNAQWPDFEVFPASPWNYGLALDEKDPAKSFKVVKKSGPLPEQPFDSAVAPIELAVKAKRVPEWKRESNGLVGKLQLSPVRSSQPLETVKLIPMGAARLRISSFPVISAGTAVDTGHYEP